MKKLAIGVSDYKKIIEEGYYYVDKTLFIKEVVSQTHQVSLICRPRKFGRTLNMTMLKYFLETRQESCEHLFFHKEIWQYDEMRALHGTFPVIYLAFGDLKEASFDQAYYALKLQLGNEYARHLPGVQLRKELDLHTLERFESLMTLSASQEAFQESILFLMHILHQAYQTPVVLLIDGIDKPVHLARENGYESSMIPLIDGLLKASVHNNSALKLALMTAVMPPVYADGKPFEGLKKAHIFSALNAEFAPYFGFTQQEVIDLLQAQNQSLDLEAVTRWYNGYTFGRTLSLYNPWSLIGSIRNQGLKLSYWASANSMQSIMQTILHSSVQGKKELSIMLTGKTYTRLFKKRNTLTLLAQEVQDMWRKLIFHGYVSYESYTQRDEETGVCGLRIPNEEVMSSLRKSIELLIQYMLGDYGRIEHLLSAFVQHDIELVRAMMQECVLRADRLYSVSAAVPGNAFFIVIWGLIIAAQSTYEISISFQDEIDAFFMITFIPSLKTEVSSQKKIIVLGVITHDQDHLIIDRARHAFIEDLKQQSCLADYELIGYTVGLIQQTMTMTSIVENLS